MKVYIELVFIENFIINYIILSESLNISKTKKDNIRIIYSSLIASLYVTIILVLKYSEYINLLLNIFVFLLMIYLSFQDNEIYNYIKHIINTIYIFSLYAGLNFFVMNFFNIDDKGGKKIWGYLISYLILKICNYTLYKTKKIKLTKENLIFNIEILVKNKIYNYKAFVDTGNNAKNLKRNMNYIFLENTNNLKEYLEECNSNSENVFINTVTNKNKIKIYFVDSVRFIVKNKIKEVKNVPVCFVDKKLNYQNDFNSLIGYDMYLDYLGGMDNE